MNLGYLYTENTARTRSQCFKLNTRQRALDEINTDTQEEGRDAPDEDRRALLLEGVVPVRVDHARHPRVHAVALRLPVPGKISKILQICLFSIY